ncbi:MAG: hypothetical protein AAFZ52_18490 [Bacteroidota bacterium]
MSRNTLFPFLLLFGLLVLTACEPDNATPRDEGPQLSEQRVNFLDPVVGQFNTFEVLSYECGTELPTETSDLTLTVEAVTPTEITFAETRSDQPDYEYSYTAERVPGNLLISPEERQGSNLFYFYGSDSIRLTAEPSAVLQYRDCVFYDQDVKFTGDYVAMIPSFTLGETTYPQLKTVSCVPIILDIDGYLLYTSESLLGSITTSTSEFGGVETTHTTVLLLKDEAGN